MPERAFLERLFRRATEAVAPEGLLERHLRREGREAVLLGLGRDVRVPLPLKVAGVGKAAARMARGCERVLGAAGVAGLVITADGCDLPLASIRCVLAGHPVPDRRGLDAAEELVRWLDRLSGPLLFLLSGGASSLLVRPRPPVTLADKIAVSRLLLASGVDITAFNTVRKHLSLAKGGGLLRHGRGAVYTLVLSDVIGDDPVVIGSGPTVADPTTHADALAILERHDLLARVPASVRQLLEAGMRGEVDETVKPGSPEAARAAALVIGSNAVALDAADDEGRRAGYLVVRMPTPLAGDSRDAAHRFADFLRAEIEAVGAGGPRRCLLAGGETTVVVHGSGHGGRNQEFALSLAPRIEGMPVQVLSVGSDGIDGPTDAAGAFVDGTTAARARRLGLDAATFLEHNDSYTFFDRLGDLFRCGPTGTNVMDLKLALIG